MSILFINNDGGGFADTIEVPEGMTVAALFAERLPGRKPADFHIRVNRLPVTAEQVLQPGDRLSATPVKIEGALRPLTFGNKPSDDRDIWSSHFFGGTHA